MAQDKFYETGPWGLDALKNHLGTETNHGQIHRQVYLGGQTELIQEYGPFSFQCGCRAWRGGIGGDLYLTPCSKAHQDLKPEGF